MQPQMPGSEVFAEDVAALVRSDQLRSWRVDIETDSTIQPDMARLQEQMTALIQGTGAFIQAWGPGVQAGIVPPDAVMDLYGALVSNFNLPKRAEDALERISNHAAQVAQQQAQQGPQEDPAAKEAAAKAAQEAQKLQMQQESEKAKLALEEKKLAAEQDREERRLEFEQYKMQEELDLKRDDIILRNATEKDEETGKVVERSGIVKRMKANEQASEQAAQVFAQSAQALQQVTQALVAAAQEMSRPKRVVRGPDGRIAGLE